MAIVAVVCAPFVLAALRAAWGRWVPTGDDAYFTVRSRDVLTANHPLLGAWSSGSLDLTEPINNLGPLQLDLLAPFTRVAPMGGTAIGVAVTNAAAIAAIAWAVARIAGRRAVVAAMIAVGLVTWTMGTEMLITPRQHQYLILPYLCLLVAAWAAATGDRWALVPAVVAGSLTAQTHLSYPVLVAALGVYVLAGQVITTRAGEARGGRRPLVVSLLLGVVLWSQTLFEQFFRSGNLGTVLFGSGGAERAGFSTGVRLVAGLLVSPDTVARPGYRQSDTQALLADPWQVIVFVVVVGAAAVVAAVAIRQGRWQAFSGLTAAVVAVVGGVIDATLLPRTVFGLAIMNYRWLWSTGAFIVMLVLLVAFRWWEQHRSAQRGIAVWAATVACVVIAVANVPRTVQHPDAARYLEEQRAVADMIAQIALVDIDGPVVIDESEMYFGHPYTYPLLVALQRQEVAFRFESPLQERRFGRHRVIDGSERFRLRLISGDPAVALAGTPAAVSFVDTTRPVVILFEPYTPPPAPVPAPAPPTTTDPSAPTTPAPIPVG